MAALLAAHARRQPWHQYCRLLPALEGSAAGDQPARLNHQLQSRPPRQLGCCWTARSSWFMQLWTAVRLWASSSHTIAMSSKAAPAAAPAAAQPQPPPAPPLLRAPSALPQDCKSPLKELYDRHSHCGNLVYRCERLVTAAASDPEQWTCRWGGRTVGAGTHEEQPFGMPAILYAGRPASAEACKPAAGLPPCPHWWHLLSCSLDCPAIVRAVTGEVLLKDCSFQACSTSLSAGG